jgi:muconolactone delta-isomerase
VYFFVTGTVTKPDQLAAHEAEETRVLNDLRQEGTVREAFRRTAGHGVFGIFVGPSLEEVQAQISRLPFVALGLLHFEYTEVTEL